MHNKHVHTHTCVVASLRGVSPGGAVVVTDCRSSYFDEPMAVRTRSQRPQHSRNLEPGPGAWILERGIWNLESGTWNLEPGTWNMEPGRKLFIAGS